MRRHVVHVFFLLVVTVPGFGDFLTDLKYIRSCNETSPIRLGALNDVLINQEFPDDSGFKCFMFCLFTKYVWMDEDGGFLIHEIKKGLDEVQTDLLEVILYECTAVNASDKCQRALDFTKCFWEKARLQKEPEPERDDQLFYQVLGA